MRGEYIRVGWYVSARPTTQEEQPPTLEEEAPKALTDEIAGSAELEEPN